jgi:ABC-type polysaccharide/polyol phosphate transport system ATPase subunit
VATRVTAERSASALTEQRGGAKPKSGEPAISVKGVTKTFRIPRHRPSTLKERVMHPLTVIPKTEFAAAQDVSFDVAEGEFFGIVGRNGSGKSTLLKLLAGIYVPDSGTVSVRGRISPFIELGVGFNPELTARDNVIVNGTLLGLTRAEIARRYPKILEFAELEEFEDLKLKNYSSGMLVRLAFSTAIQVDGEVLLFDEVLAVGDTGFQEKCFEEFRRMRRDGRTMVLVTHSMEAVRRFCDRAMLIERGKVVRVGDPDSVAEHYREMVSGKAEAVGAHHDSSRFGDNSADALGAWVEDSKGERRDVVEQGERITFCAAFEFRERFTEPALGIQVKGENGSDAFAMNTIWAERETGTFEAGERVVLRVAIDNRLGVGAYTLTPGVANRDGTRIADLRLNLSGFRVDGKRWTGAAVDLPYELSVERDSGGGKPR